MSKPVDIATIDVAAIFAKASGNAPADPAQSVIVNDWKKTAAGEVEKRKKFDDEEGEVVE